MLIYIVQIKPLYVIPVDIMFDQINQTINYDFCLVIKLEKLRPLKYMITISGLTPFTMIKCIVI